MYVAQSILGESDWDIRVDVTVTDTQEDAENIGRKTSDFHLVTHKGRAALRHMVDGHPRYFFDDDVTIRFISPEKKAVMGEPIDVTQPGAIEKITASIGDPAYTITDDDMIDTGATLADFIKVYGEGYRPDCIAYGTIEITQDQCRHALGTTGHTHIRSMESPEIEAHIRDVQDFNARTMREQVPHPGFLTIFSFCPFCGSKLDRDGNEALFQKKLAAMGGFDGEPR